MTDIDRYGS